MHALAPAGRHRRRLARLLLLATTIALFWTTSAQAYQVHISITGAGQVTETTSANLVGSGCVTAAANPTGTVGKDCYAGTPSGDYGWNWDVDYVATPKSGYHFDHWQSDGTATPGVICDRSTPAASTTTYTGSTCKFRTPYDLQTRAVFVDDTAPSVQSLAGPNQVVNGATTFTFSATADPTVSGFECRVVGVHDWVSCSSGRSENPASGSYTFDVRAVDASGNRSGVSSWGWTVDKVAPETSLPTGPSGTVASTSANFEFSSNEAGTFECTLDGSAAACTSPRSFDNLGQGSHTFTVAARDPAGNLDASPSTRTWTVDTVAPDTSLDGAFGPSGSTESTSAEFRFSSSEPDSTFVCQLDSAAVAPCASPVTLNGLGVGGHTLRVWARDAAGNSDISEAARTWTVTAPASNGGTNTDTSTPGTTTTGTSTTNTPTSTGNTPPSQAADPTPASGGQPPASAAVAAISGPAKETLFVTRTGVLKVRGVTVSCASGCKVAISFSGMRLSLTKRSFAVIGQSGVQFKLAKKALAALKRAGKAKVAATITAVPVGEVTPVKKKLTLMLKYRGR